jgi:peptidoglycan/LPS O-acetylase OafA/YrhL
MLQNIYNKFRRITTNQLYFPEIDGIRFVAILLVVLFHIHGYFMGKTGVKGTPYYWLDTFLMNGDRGVELFFVLSGFILCLPFAQHYISDARKPVLKKYYLRRVTRLEPPYFIALTAIFFMQLAMHIHPADVLIPSWLASLIYSHGLIYHHSPLLTVVAWSLEIEIQFYLLAPLLFRLLALPVHTRRLILTTAIIALIVAQRFYTLPFLCIYQFAQYFMAGILLADFHVSNTAAGFFNKKGFVLPALIALLVIVYLPIKNELIPAEAILFSKLVLPFLIGLFYYIVLKNDAVKRIFSYKFVPIIGGMCYSIYLLHYTIISMLGRFTLNLHITSGYLPNLALQTVLLCLPVLLISAIFYLYIERPFMASKWLDMLVKKDKKPAPRMMPADQVNDN